MRRGALIAIVFSISLLGAYAAEGDAPDTDTDTVAPEAVPAPESAADPKGKSGTFQISTVIMASTYSLFGGDGPDLVRYTWFGISFKSTAGPLLRGLIDITVVIPFKTENQLYPSSEFSKRDTPLPPFGIDAVLGLAYPVNLSPVYLLFGTGLHTVIMAERFRTLTAFGMTLDTQIYIKMGRVFTLQLGGKFNVDFGGIQNLTQAPKAFSGVSYGFGFYSGIGLSY